MFDRPKPPAELEDPEPLFLPAPELRDWHYDLFVSKSSPLYNPRLSHLNSAHIGFQWTNVPYTRHMKRAAALCELPQVQGNAFVRERYKQLLRGWFGSIPDFSITFDYLFSLRANNVSFCATGMHEMIHCGQQVDKYGCPKFRKDGRPMFALLGHDLEAFVDEVVYFGVDAVGDSAREFVAAANREPLFAGEHIDFICGTCLR